MNIQDDSNQLYDQLLLLLQKPFLKKQPFYFDFINKWTKILNDNLHNPILASASPNKPNSQIYKQSIYLDSGYSFDLHFDIPHIQAFYFNSLKSGVKIFFDSCNLIYQNSGLYLKNYECLYNIYNTQNQNSTWKFGTITPPFVAYIPIVPRQYVVIDGNHRISSAILHGSYNLSACLLCPEFTPLFFISSAEIVAYLFLMDICYITENVTSINNNSINNLSIYKTPSLITNLIHK